MDPAPKFVAPIVALHEHASACVAEWTHYTIALGVLSSHKLGVYNLSHVLYLVLVPLFYIKGYLATVLLRYPRISGIQQTLAQVLAAQGLSMLREECLGIRKGLLTGEELMPTPLKWRD